MRLSSLPKAADPLTTRVVTGGSRNKAGAMSDSECMIVDEEEMTQLTSTPLECGALRRKPRLGDRASPISTGDLEERLNDEW